MKRLRRLLRDDDDREGLAFTEAEYEALHRDDPPGRPDPLDGEPTHPFDMPDERVGRWA